jgi:tetratricopeptide (TPR) repeat protein
MSETLDRAYALLRQGLFDEAIDGLNACLSSEPDNVSALRGRGVAYFQMRKWGAAAADFSRVRDLDPEDLEGWVALGASLAMDLKVYPAIEVLETLVEKHPTFVRGRIQLGQLYFRLCVTAKGRLHMEAALASRPTLAERKIIEKTLEEQKKLDKKRYYRPDFEALRRRVREEGRV